MRTLGLSAQDGVGGVEAVIADTAASGPMIEGPATALWVGVGAFLVIFLGVMLLLIRARVTIPARRKTQETTQYFEPTGDEYDEAFDDETPAPTYDAEVVDADGDAALEPAAEDIAEPDEREHWDAPDDDMAAERPEPVEEPESRAPFGGFLGGKSEEEQPAAPAQNDNHVDQREPDYQDADYEDVAPAAPAEDQRQTPNVDAAFVQALSSEFAAYRKTTHESIDRLSRRMDALAGASPESLSTLAREIASLKAFLSDKPAAISTAGRIQLSELVRSVLPARQYAFSQSLSTGRTADCLIHSPNLAAPFAIDARFPVEAFDLYYQDRDDFALEDQATDRYRGAILRHMVDIAENLIVRGETADFAIMFIPAEPIFHDLYASFGDVVQDSYRARVWILSPTTLMASLHMMNAIANGGNKPGRGAPGGSSSGGNPSGPGGASTGAADKPAGIHDESWQNNDSDARIAASLERLQREQEAAEKQDADRKKRASGGGPGFPLRSQGD